LLTVSLFPSSFSPQPSVFSRPSTVSPMSLRVPVQDSPACPGFRGVTNHQSRVFARPCRPRRALFSYSYESLFLQLLSFDKHLRCPRVWGSACNFLVTHRRAMPTTPFAATHPKLAAASPFPATHPKLAAASPFPATHPKKQGVAMIIVNQTTAHLTSKDGQRNISAQRCTLASPTSYET